MRLLKTDRLIIEVILKDGNTGMHVKAICKALYTDKAKVHRSIINRKLNRLRKHLVVQRIGDKQHQPILWKINANRKDIVWIVVSCPKPECNTQRIASNDQTIVYCANPECKRPNGERTRFYITEERIDNYLPLPFFPPTITNQHNLPLKKAVLVDDKR